VRALAVDYGRRRIGLAVSDALGISVRGLPTIARGPDLAGAAAAVAAVARETGAEVVVVGLPLHADGRESRTSEEVRRFGALLRGLVACPLEYLDEGLTSWEAEERLRERGRPLQEARRGGEVDREAARTLLLSWLRERENRPPSGPGDLPGG
jgi:putative Holliday junction resolvase